jgi:hypothetical protein
MAQVGQNARHVAVEHLGHLPHRPGEGCGSFTGTSGRAPLGGPEAAILPEPSAIFLESPGASLEIALPEDLAGAALFLAHVLWPYESGAELFNRLAPVCASASPGGPLRARRSSGA